MKIIVSYLMGNCENYIDLSLESIYEYVDTIIIVYDTTSKDSTKQKLDLWKQKLKDKIIILEREFEHSQNIKNSNSNARNFYLDYLKKNHNGDLVLILDADEIVDERFKNFIDSEEIKKIQQNHILSIHMRHLIHNLSQEDYTRDIHFVHNRMFIITEDLKYPDSEHPILFSKSPDVKYSYTNLFTIWHIASIEHLFIIKKKYYNHLAKSKSHTPQFLRQWYLWNIFGTYPSKKFNPVELPSVIKKYFDIIDDEIYFDGRGLELKHFIDCNHWIEYFKLRDNKKRVLVCGDGLGVRTFALRAMGIEAFGFDISKWAVENNIGRFDIQIYWQEDITEQDTQEDHDLVVVYDVLEHLTYEQLDYALNKCRLNMSKDGKILFSIPFKDENQDLYKDDTHKIFETREWWVKKLEEHGFKIKETPEWFNFYQQILVAEK